MMGQRISGSSQTGSILVLFQFAIVVILYAGGRLFLGADIEDGCRFGLGQGSLPGPCGSAGEIREPYGLAKVVVTYGKSLMQFMTFYFVYLETS